MAQLTQRVVARIPENPVEFWLSRLDERTRPSNRSHLDRFMHWLAKQPSWENATPRDMLVRHLDSEDSYLVLDLLQRYINSLVLRKSSKRKAYSVVRSFFVHNRCGLPLDSSKSIQEIVGDAPFVRPFFHCSQLASHSVEGPQVTHQLSGVLVKHVRELPKLEE